MKQLWLYFFNPLTTFCLDCFVLQLILYLHVSMCQYKTFQNPNVQKSALSQPTTKIIFADFISVCNLISHSHMFSRWLLAIVYKKCGLWAWILWVFSMKNFNCFYNIFSCYIHPIYFWHFHPPFFCLVSQNVLFFP